MNPFTIYPRHPSAPDTYHINGAWAPAAITAVDKRFTDAELAAEFQAADAACAIYWLTDREKHAAAWIRMKTFHRFCTQPAHDENPA